MTTKRDYFCFFGTRQGGETLDQDDEGGNPFASALIELLAYTDLNLVTFAEELVKLTQQKSNALQIPEVQNQEALIPWQILPVSRTEKRVALVIVFSDYSESVGIPSLQGVTHDAVRVSSALTQAGFRVDTLNNPSRVTLDTALANFKKHSLQADTALIYMTGHGGQVDQTIYLLPGDFASLEYRFNLLEHAVPLATFSNAMHAKINLLFYAGCRTSFL